MNSRNGRRVIRFVLVLLSVITLVSGRSAVADELLLKDGSRLLGKVISMAEGNLKFETGYAGVITVQWDHVSEMSVDEPVLILLKDATRFTVTGMQHSGDVLLVERSPVDPPVTLSPGALAYVNPEPWQLGDGVKWSGRVNLDLTSQRGNTDKEDLEADVDMQFRRQQDRLGIYGQFEKDTSDSTVTIQTWKLNNKYDYFISKKFYYGASLNFEHDKFADLDLRTSAGPHVGYQFFESAALNLDADIGILFVQERFDVADDDDYLSMGWRVNFDRLLVPDRVQFYHRHAGLLDLGDIGNLTINSWTGFRFPLYQGIVASTEAEVEYDGDVPDGVDETDISYRLKLGYQW